MQVKGIPNQLARSINQARPVSVSEIPLPEDTVHLFEEKGGNLTVFNQFGTDPLIGSPN